MYNESWKHAFSVETYDKLSMREACATLFEATEPYEREWGADLCTQSAEVLKPVVEELVGMRAKSTKLRLSILREYVSYCLRNNYPGACDGMLQVKVTGLEKLQRNTVKNPLHLQRYLDQICDPEQDETYDNVLRFYHWMAYSGVPEEEILKLTANDVDLERMVIRAGGTDYPLYRESLPSVSNCMRLTQFVSRHPYHGVDKLVRLDRAPGDALVRGTRSVPSVTSIRSMLSRRVKQKTDAGETQQQLSYYRVWLSGVFYRAYEQELAGFPPDFSGVAFRQMQGREYRLGGRNTPRGKQRKLSGEYMTDYLRWKSTLTT